MNTPQIGDEVMVVYRDPTNILSAIDPEVGSATAYGRLGVTLDAIGTATGITVESDGGATFISASSLISVAVMA